MKKVFALLFSTIALLSSSTLKSQTIQSLSVIPQSPGSSDIIRLAIRTEFGSGSCWLNGYFPSVIGNTINVDISYSTGLLAVICDRTDTLVISGPLNCGQYTVNVTASVSGAFYGTTNASTGFTISCGAPGNLTASNVSAKSAKLNWIPSCAFGYQVRYRESGTGGWKTINVNSNIGNVNIGGLKGSRAYEWQVRSKCGTHPNVYSNYTALQNFTTPAPRLRSPGEIDVAFDGNQLSAFTIAPNPSTGEFNVLFNQDIQYAQLQVFNVLGEKVYSKKIEDINAGSIEQIQLPDILSGIYFLKLFNEEISETQKLIVK